MCDVAYVAQVEQLERWAHTQMVDPFETRAAFDQQLALPLVEVDMDPEGSELRKVLGLGR